MTSPIIAGVSGHFFEDSNPIIAGGEHITAAPEYAFLSSPVDYAVLGEGEETLVDGVLHVRNPADPPGDLVPEQPAEQVLLALVAGGEHDQVDLQRGIPVLQNGVPMSGSLDGDATAHYYRIDVPRPRISCR